MATEDKNSLEKVSDRATVAYSGLSWLRLLVTSVPYIGGPIDLIMSTQAGKFIQKRIETLLQNLANEVEKLDEKTIDKEFLESEEFFDLLALAMEAAARTRHKEKICLYARVLSGATITHKRKHDDPEQYLKILSELSLRELQLLAAIVQARQEVDGQKDKELIGTGPLAWGKLAETTRSVPEDIEYLLVRIQGTGLIQRDIRTVAGYNANFKFTPLFDKMMAFIGQDNFYSF